MVFNIGKSKVPLSACYSGCRTLNPFHSNQSNTCTCILKAEEAKSHKFISTAHTGYEIIPRAERVGLRLCERWVPDVGEDDVGAVAVVGRDRRVDVDGAARRITHTLRSHSHKTSTKRWGTGG